jgi:hypothetical protein
MAHYLNIEHNYIIEQSMLMQTIFTKNYDKFRILILKINFYIIKTELREIVLFTACDKIIFIFSNRVFL